MNIWVLSVLMLVAGLFGWACRELRLRSKAPALGVEEEGAAAASAGDSSSTSEPSREVELEVLRKELASLREQLEAKRERAAREEASTDEPPGHERGSPSAAPAAQADEPASDASSGGSRAPARPRVPPPPRLAGRAVSDDERRLAAAQDQARFAAIQLAASRSEVQKLQARLKQANEVIKRKTELLRQCELKLGSSRLGSTRTSRPPARSTPAGLSREGATDSRRARETSSASLQLEVEAKAARLQEARSAAEQAQQRARELEQSLQRVHVENETRAARIEALLEEVTELRQRLGSVVPDSATPPVLFDAPTQGAPDELKRLHGVGPKVQQLLNQLGVYYFWQIAEWQPEHVRYVERELPQLRGRIERDEWCKQAAALSEASAGLASKTVPIAATAERAGVVGQPSAAAKGREPTASNG